MDKMLFIAGMVLILLAIKNFFWNPPMMMDGERGIEISKLIIGICIMYISFEIKSKQHKN